MAFNRMGSRFIVVTVLLLLFRAVHAQSGNDDAIAKALVPWETTCAPRGCLMQADVLRGVSGDTDHPPNPADVREYIGLNVAIDRNDRSPAYVAIAVDPRMDRKQGIFIAFAKTSRDGSSWKTGIDSDGAIPLPIANCKDDGCTARVLKGLTQGKNGQVDLLQKFLNSDHLLVLYVLDGHPYRTAVGLASFKLEYQRIMNSELVEKR